jgi:hypothetical protein
MSDATARQECEALVRTQPHALRFDGLEPHDYCGRGHRIARFTLETPDGIARFVLVPGGEVALGFDGRDFRPTFQQIESFAWAAEAYGIDQPIRDFVDGHTSTPRTASLHPILVEEVAHEVSVEPVRDDDPVLAVLQREARDIARTEYSGGDLVGYIIDRRSDGTCQAWYRRPTSLADLQNALADAGMRLLTCDEWEHACGAEAATLFRWGDDCPAEFYPPATSVDQPRLLSGKPRSAQPQAIWDLHVRPNLLGLRIASNPYKMDLVSDGPHILGGDGGCSACGGAGFFLGWLPLATAFRDPCSGEWFSPNNVADGACHLRRVIAIQ